MFNQKKYINLYNNELQFKFNQIDLKDFNNTVGRLNKIKKKQKIILCGNGGSAAISSHVAVDITKNLKTRAINFNEADFITCYANDYGHENWMSEAIKSYGDRNDILILISSSGNSKNVCKAAKTAKKKGIFVITFSGFFKNNPLSRLGKINFWVDSKNYNIVEITHLTWLLCIVDYIKHNKKKI